MGEAVQLHYQEWGKGAPVLALHGLGLESSSFTGLAEGVANLGMRMMAIDLPGFGLSPLQDNRPLTAAALAEPVITLAKKLKSAPIVMGMSLGARVALECALQEPKLFRGVVMMAPPLPRRKHRWAMVGARILNPELAKNLPMEKIWPWLKRQADKLETKMIHDAERDWMGRAGKRAIYYMSCPATRWAFVSAARELAMDPAYGPKGLWTRLPHLRVPAAFVWGDKDKVIPMDHLPLVEKMLPDAFQIHVPCAGHFDNGPHFLCMEEGAVEAVRLVDEVAGDAQRLSELQKYRVSDCVLVDNKPHTAAG